MMVARRTLGPAYANLQGRKPREVWGGFASDAMGISAQAVCFRGALTGCLGSGRWGGELGRPIAMGRTGAAHPGAKRSLHISTGALAVDNESHVVASVAAVRGLPMTAVRVIMDPVNRELPAAALAAVRERDDRSRRTDPRDHERAPRITDAASDRCRCIGRLRCAGSLPKLLGPGLALPSLQAFGPESSSSIGPPAYGLPPGALIKRNSVLKAAASLIPLLWIKNQRAALSHLITPSRSK
jgi:hypothetical protein